MLKPADDSVSTTPRLWAAVDVWLTPNDVPESALDLEEHLLLAIDDLAATALEARGPDEWRVHFATPPEATVVADALRATLGAAFLGCEPVWVSDEAWAARSQQALRAITVGRIVVAPPWDRPSGPLVIEIEPSMGFGTGHHQSTRLCLTVLQRLPLDGRSMLDVGTGSGVLAIAAARLGAHPVGGLDIDADACVAAARNVDRNGLSGRVSISRMALGEAHAAADVVCANLTADVLSAESDALGRLVNPGGTLVVSGVMLHQVPYVREAFSRWTLVGDDREDDWAALTFARGS